MEIDNFIKTVPDFFTLSTGKQIDIVVYYLLIVKKNQGVRAKDIDICFEELHIPPYSNSGSYLNNFSKSKNPKFIKSESGYKLIRTEKEKIDSIIGIQEEHSPTNELFTLSVFDNTRGYIITIARQAASCYDLGLYDASFIMTRKLLELLIIESFERHKIVSKIQNSGGHFFHLADLINLFLNETSWNISRNTKQSLPRIKKLADLSAHNRRFIAKKADIDKLHDDLRITLQEIINLIDYPNWTK